jgi:hypothetical protein
MVSAPKKQQQRCEHCGFSINEKAQRLNSVGLPTDCKGNPKPVEQPIIPGPRRCIKA